MESGSAQQVLREVGKDKGCIALWHVDANGTLAGSRGLRLQTCGAPPQPVAGGVFAERSLRFNGTGWLRVPRQQLGALDIHGAGAQVSVLAWFRWNREDLYQAIAGIWNETACCRQYCLFLNLNTRYNSLHNLHGHISHTGGPTPGHEFCVTYATGGGKVKTGEWTFAALTYDGSRICIYRNGILDVNTAPDPFSDSGNTLNPYHYAGPIHDGGPDGADFTIGAVDRSGEMGNWFHGDLSGLAVFNRALHTNEISRWHSLSRPLAMSV